MSASPLAQYTACEVSDALIKLGLPNGGHIPDIHIMTEIQQVVCGPAYTVRMVEKHSDIPAPKLSQHFIDTAPIGSFIVIDAPSHVKNAVWGGLMSAGAQTRSAVGVVISGRCRDIAELNHLGFPVFARGQSTLGQSTFTRPSEVNVPLTISPQSQGAHPSKYKFPSITVNPGDWIIADHDGVVCVPREFESQVVELATKGRAIDEMCMRDIKDGKGVQASLEAHRI